MNNLMTRSFLSYANLKKEAFKDLEEGGGGQDYDSHEIEISRVGESLRPFFEEAGLLKEEIASIRGLLALLEAENQESKAALDPNVAHAFRDRINGHIVEVLKQARRIGEQLESMDSANAGNRRLSGCHKGTPVDRARTSVTNGLRKKLKDLMMDFQVLRQRIMADYREEVVRWYFTIIGELPQEAMVDKMIEEAKSDEVLKRAVTGDRKQAEKEKVAETVHEIQDRHHAAKEVEKSLLELHQVFLGMALMVEVQGEKMDDIEHHVSSAAHYVKDGTKELKSANGYHSNSRKCVCIVVVLLLLLILLVVVPFAFKYQPGKTG